MVDTKNTDELRISVNENFSDISPFTNHSTYSVFIQSLLFDTLVQVDANNQISPGLCSSFENIKHSPNWKCQLDNNIKYHDGKNFNPEDILYSFNMHKKLASPFKSVLENIESIIISADKREITFNLKKNDHIFLPSLNAIYIVSPRDFNDSGVPISSNELIGTGPYKILKIEPNVISLTKNPDYHEGSPKIKQITFEYYADNSIALRELIESKITLQAFFDFNHEQILSNIDYIQRLDSSNPILFGIFFNMANPILKNSDIRVALNLLIDREAVLNRSELKKRATIAQSVTRPNSPYLINDKASNFVYDPLLATELLNKNGWHLKNGYFENKGQILEFQLLISEGSYISENVTKQIIKHIEAAGIKVSVKKLSMKDLVNKILNERQFELMLSNYSCDYDFLTSYLTWHERPNSPLNFSSYNNPEAVKLLDEARFASDESTFTERYQAFQKVMHSDPPMLYLFWYNYPIYYNEKLKGINAEVFNRINSLRNAWISNETH